MGAVKKNLILMFFALNVVMMVTASLPNKSLLGKKVLHSIRYYQSVLGLHQTWSMFAPNPASRNSYVEAEIDFVDGSKERWTFPRPSQMDSVEKFLGGERYRKFAQEHLKGKRPELWKDLGRFTSREVEAIESQGQRRSISGIRFYKYVNTVEYPDKFFVPHGQLAKDYKETLMFTYNPQEKVIHEARNNK